MSLIQKILRLSPKNSSNKKWLLEGYPSLIETSEDISVTAMLLCAPMALMKLSEKDARIVVAFMRTTEFAAGTTVIQQGDTADTGCMMLLLNGEITVEILANGQDDPMAVNVLGPGSLIGEMALLDGEARSASCTANSDVRCAVLTRDALDALTVEHPVVAARFLTAVAQRLATRLRECNHKLMVYGQLMKTMQQEIDTLIPTPDHS